MRATRTLPAVNAATPLLLRRRLLTKQVLDAPGPEGLRDNVPVRSSEQDRATRGERRSRKFGVSFALLTGVQSSEWVAASKIVRLVESPH